NDKRYAYQGHEEYYHQAQLPVYADHQPGGDEEHEYRPDAVVDAWAEEGAHRAQVVGGAGHDVARVHVLEEALLHALEMSEHVVPQVILDHPRYVVYFVSGKELAYVLRGGQEQYQAG